MSYILDNVCGCCTSGQSWLIRPHGEMTYRASNSVKCNGECVSDIAETLGTFKLTLRCLLVVVEHRGIMLIGIRHLCLP